MGRKRSHEKVIKKTWINVTEGWHAHLSGIRPWAKSLKLREETARNKRQEKIHNYLFK